MKTLKLDHQSAVDIIEGKKTSTWRMFDDKDLRVNDVVAIIDKVDPSDQNSWHVIGEVKINKILEKRLRDINNADYTDGQQYDSLERLLAAFQSYYPDQVVTADTPVKILYFALKPYSDLHQAPKQGEQQTQSDDRKTTKVVKLFTDGGSRGNPGPSASGYALLTEDNEVVESAGEYLGVTTNNQAEYQALKLGLDAARRQGAREVQAHMDSMLVVNQMKGIFKVKNRDLWPIHDSIKQLVEGFNKVSFTHVPRELNKLADSEVNKALDAHLAGQTAPQD
ncbi:MAG: reverse transcriptase-like protein [Candidatus Saccharimonadales bacterium]